MKIYGKVTKYGSGKVFIRAVLNCSKMFFPLFNPPFESLVKLTIRLLDILNVKVSSSTINKALQDHPEYPSLLSVADVLNQWNVKNMAIKVDQSRIYELPLPFLAHKKTFLGDHFELVTDLTEMNLEYFDDTNKKKNISIENFQNSWSGIALLAQATEDSGEFNYEINQKKERKSALLPYTYLAIGLIITILTIVMVFIQPFLGHRFEINWAVLTALKFIGVIMTIFLLLFDLNQENHLTYKICGNGPRSNCHAVLESKGAQIIPGLRWSEVGFFYFFGGWILTVILIHTGIQAISLLFTINLLALPYVFYSIYYQAIIIKQWCKICLIVLALLILEFASFSIVGFPNHYAYLMQIDTTFLPALVFAFSLPIVLWYVLKFHIIRHREKAAEVQLLNKIKFNSSVFLHLLKCQIKMPHIQEGCGIVFQNQKDNNSNSNVHVLLVLNLHCSACAQAQSFIEELIEKTENLKVQIVFVGTENFDDQTLLIMNHLLNIAEHLGGEEAIKALGDWYSIKEMDYNTFSTRHPIKREIDIKLERIKHMKQWCEEANIMFTPTYYVNEYMLPDGYFMEDLKYFFSTDTFRQ